MAGCNFSCPLTLKPGQLQCINRSTDRIDNCLSCDRGRRAFRDYLESHKLDDDEAVLTMWEMCRRVLDPREDRKKMFEQLCQMADSIGELDQGRMELLEAAQSNPSQIDDVTKNIKEWCARELERTTYKLFIKQKVEMVQGQRS